MVIFFNPVVEEGQPHPGDVYAAPYNDADGTFQVTGKDGQGMPPGKYRISVEKMRGKKDLFDGEFGREKSPIVREVTAATREIVVDLVKPNG